MSNDRIKYLKHNKIVNYMIIIIRIIILFVFLILWEILSFNHIINSFFYSSPSLIIKSIFTLIKDGIFINNIIITIYEVLISFIISLIISFIVSFVFWYNKTISRIFLPYLSVLNSLPKVALGPLIVIWFGASIKSIIVMSLMISSFITIIDLYQFYINTNYNYILLMKSFKCNRITIFNKVVLPSNKNNIKNVLKVNMSMNFIGVIMGELLVSKEGIGYLIGYGSQIFNINMVIMCIMILGLLSIIMIKCIDLFIS